MDIEDYLASKTLQRAVERTLELIGEAASQLGGARPKIAVPWDDIIALRIVLAHVYNKVEQRLLYRTATQDVPKLLAALNAAKARRQK